MNGGRSMNQRNAAIIDGWVRLYICITTNDINEFYKALGGNTPREGTAHHYTWETVNNPKKINEKRKR